MRFDAEQVKGYAKVLVDFTVDKGIETPGDLEKIAGSHWQDPEDSEMILIEYHPPGLLPPLLSIKYSITWEGTPLEVHLDVERDITSVILRSTDLFEHYLPIRRDSFCNRTQYRIERGVSIPQMRALLQDL